MHSSTPLFSFPWTGLGKRMESQVRKALYDFEMLTAVPKVGVALSGGKDSLTLLLMLKAIAGRGFPPFELAALHVGGAFSCGASVSEDYLRRCCAALEVPLFVRTSTKTLEQLECYSCSRERRTLLFEAAKEWGCDCVAFGHHRDDQAETLLMNLFHKGEFASPLPKLRMQEYGVTIIRPLVYVAETDIITFAQQQGFRRITCRCPVGQTSMRSKVEQLLEIIELQYPHARANLARAGLLYGSKKAEHP